MVLTNNESYAERIRYLTTTAKKPHEWEYYHNKVGYNYRMPNLNAAIGLAQMEYFNVILEDKRETAETYESFFGEDFIKEPSDSQSNYWLNSILMKDKEERDGFLAYSNGLRRARHADERHAAVADEAVPDGRP